MNDIHVISDCWAAVSKYPGPGDGVIQPLPCPGPGLLSDLFLDTEAIRHKHQTGYHLQFSGGYILYNQ